ncbi:hypothetical protein HPB50_001024 [Hyalomma asiaticum]|uniref:Uncharacterized protein n=1 Tax=Hyalomma asiaticum TaxID=266040 RepID=A0ACB7RQ79_HYAAI|nr:hypothetical protein HPB50_001024 [Hyalomma asiaticum]
MKNAALLPWRIAAPLLLRLATAMLPVYGAEEARTYYVFLPLGYALPVCRSEANDAEPCSIGGVQNSAISRNIFRQKIKGVGESKVQACAPTVSSFDSSRSTNQGLEDHHGGEVAKLDFVNASDRPVAYLEKWFDFENSLFKRLAELDLHEEPIGAPCSVAFECQNPELVHCIDGVCACRYGHHSPYLCKEALRTMKTSGTSSVFGLDRVKYLLVQMRCTNSPDPPAPLIPK